MRTRRSFPSAPPAEQKTKTSSTCNLDETFDAAPHALLLQENVDVNVQPQHRRGKGLVNVAREKLGEQRTSTRKRVLETTSSKKVIETQGKLSNSKNRAISRETPPTFELAHKKKTMVRKRKLLKEQEEKEQCDQKRIADLVEYFKSLDSQRLNIVS
ncbi:hypothetical protein FI667_g1162, partial [Globisporangium splendens]